MPADEPLPDDWRDGDHAHRRAHPRRAAAPPVDPRHHRRPAASGRTRAPLRPVAAGRRVARRARFDDKLDIVTVVDEYVFGYCLHERNNLQRRRPATTRWSTTSSELLVEDEYPALAGDGRRDGLAASCGRASTPTPAVAGRFDRNLARLLAGFEASLRADAKTSDSSRDLRRDEDDRLARSTHLIALGTGGGAMEIAEPATAHPLTSRSIG